MKKEKKKKEEKDERKAQRIGIQKPMKGKGFKKYIKKKKRKAQSAKVSKPKRSQGKLGWDPKKCQSSGISGMHNTAQIRSQRLKRKKIRSQATSHAVRDQKV